MAMSELFSSYNRFKDAIKAIEYIFNSPKGVYYPCILTDWSPKSISFAWNDSNIVKVVNIFMQEDGRIAHNLQNEYMSKKIDIDAEFIIDRMCRLVPRESERVDRQVDMISRLREFKAYSIVNSGGIYYIDAKGWHESMCLFPYSNDDLDNGFYISLGWAE
jgi:hypothetical protein